MDIIKKINTNYNSNLQRKNIQYILDFVLLWNLFELKYFEKYFKENKLENFIKNNNYNEINELDDIFYIF